jgi:predicted outer membrane repeat protein
MKSKLPKLTSVVILALGALLLTGMDGFASKSAPLASDPLPMDILLVIDASESMTSAADPGDPMRDPGQCNQGHNCHPFEEIKEAARGFVGRFNFPSDRVAVVTFSDGARLDLSFSGDKATVQNAIDALEVIEPDICDTTSGPCREYARDDLDNIIDLNGDGIGDQYLGFVCPVYNLTGNPETCGTSSIGQGLFAAETEFDNPVTFREGSRRVVILLTDGAANGPASACPHSTWTSPFCRDHDATTRHCFAVDDTSCLEAGGVYDPDNYDADDYARDLADFLTEDQNALIYTIGLGEVVQTSIPVDANGLGAGEQLLRYAANIGGGIYYFSPTGDSLDEIFLDIFSHLSSDLTHPAAFTKASPANGAVDLPTDQSIQWDSSIGAIDYEYCFDTVNNESCDANWTSTYHTSVALHDIPLSTTFYWQVRANNMDGTTYANDGAWWSFGTCTPALITVTNTNDSGPGSLRQALADICSGGTINFDMSLSGQTIRGSSYTIDKDISIDGSALPSQIKIDGNDSSTVFKLYNSDVVAILSGLTITNGRGEGIGMGGGIYNNGTLIVTDITFSANNASTLDTGMGHGGAIYNDGTLTVLKSTFSGNSAPEYGGAIYNVQGTVIVANSTFFNNSAYDGGGIYNYNGTLTVSNSTFSGNSATTSGGGIYNDSLGTLNYANSIIANSISGGDCLNSGTLSTNINNIVEDNSCSAGFSGDPKLSPLADNGGPTWTMALLADSPAIDAGNDTVCTNDPVNNLDQRGIFRLFGAHCDIGAYEFKRVLVNVYIGDTKRGNYYVTSGGQQRVEYNLDSGPVKVASTNGVPIIAALRDSWWDSTTSTWTSFVQMMGLPKEQLSDTYYFPSYNNRTLSGQLRFGNVDTVGTWVRVVIGGVERGRYYLDPSEQQRVEYALDSGPVVIQSETAGVKIIAALRDAWYDGKRWTSFSQMMGLPKEQLSDSYYFPSYNSLTVSEQLRFGNVDTVGTWVRVVIGGVERGRYFLEPNEQQRVVYAVDSGPVVVESETPGVKIIVALRDAWHDGRTWTGFAQMMGLPKEQLADTYYLPAYNNISLSGQLRFGNVDTVGTWVRVVIGGVERGRYFLEPSEQVRVEYDLDSGPVVIASETAGVKIIAALRDAWHDGKRWTGFAQMMGLPSLSDTYYFPSYNNVSLSGQLRFGMP